MIGPTESAGIGGSRFDSPPTTASSSQPQVSSSSPVDSGASPPSPIASTKDLIVEINKILKNHDPSLSFDQLNPERHFQISMHFKRPADDPEGVLIQTWERKIVDKDNDKQTYHKLNYCVPMEVEIRFLDDETSEKFDFSFRTTTEVPFKAPSRRDRLEKEVLAATLVEARERAMYHIYIQALAFRQMIKAGVNSENQQYLVAKQKINAFVRDEIAVYSLANIKDYLERWEETHRRLKNKNLEKLGIGLKDDSEPFFVNFLAKTSKAAKIGDKTFANRAQKYARVHLKLDTNDRAVTLPETIAKLVPPSDSREIATFKTILEKEKINPRNLLDYWPAHIESDYERFREKSKLFVPSSSSNSRLGRIRRLLGHFIPSRTTGRLRKLKSEIQKYEKDVASDSISPSSKKKPKSCLGRLKKEKDRLAQEQHIKNKNNDKINQFRLNVLNAEKPGDNQISLEEFKNLPSSAAALIDKEWEAKLPSLDPEVREEWEEVLQEAKDQKLKNIEKKFEDQKDTLLSTHREFKAEFEDLKKLSEDISARSNWLNTAIPDDVWETYANANEVVKNLNRIFKLTADAPKRFKRIQRIFDPRPSSLTNIENA